MDSNEPPSTRNGPPARGSAPTIWVVGSGETACDHPEEARTYRGGDGQNGYYRCDHCEAAIVVQDEIGELV